VAIWNTRNLLGLAAACGGAFCVLLLLAYGAESARLLDASALQGFVELQGDRVGPLAERIAKFGHPGPVLLLTAGLVALSAARGRFRQALAIGFLVGATSVSSQVLKLCSHTRARTRSSTDRTWTWARFRAAIRRRR
jgi:hypothetical protein